jgi:hypothetical protein
MYLPVSERLGFFTDILSFEWYSLLTVIHKPSPLIDMQDLIR